MTLDQERKKYLNKKSQFLIIETVTGNVIESSGTLFSFFNIYGELPFFESLKDVLIELELEMELFFPCVELSMAKGNHFDIRCIKSTSSKVFCVIEDFTEHYLQLKHFQQERNDSLIEGEYREVHQYNLKLEKELLEVKNAELERNQEFKTSVYNGLSHDMRSPINSIMGLSKLISKPGLEEEKRKRYLSAITSSGDYLVSMLNNLLDMASIESGNFQLKKSEFQLKTKVENIASSFAFLAHEKKLNLTISVKENVPDRIKFDQLRMSQIISNLLSNAIKYTHEGSVGLALEMQSDGLLKVVVTDTGIGVDQNELGKITEAFNQVSNTENSHVQGFGLGLNIVARLVDLLGAQLSIESSLGVGTTFEILFPVEVIENGVELELIESEGSKDIRVLVVDDDPLNLMVVSETLSGNNYKVTTSLTIEQALKELENEEFNLVLLDWYLGSETALDFLHYLQKFSRFIPILITSGEEIQNISEFYQQGVRGHIKKPFSQLELLSQLEKIVESENQKLPNIEYLKMISNNDINLAQSMIGIFKSSIKGDLEKIQKAIETEDSDLLKLIIHKITPGYKYVGMGALLPLIDELVLSGQEESISKLKELKDKTFETLTRLDAIDNLFKL